MEEVKKKFSIREIFNFSSLISFIILLSVQTIVFLLVYYFKGWTNIGALDGTFAAGVIGVAISCLTFAANDGTFDVFTVGFANLFAVAKKDGTKKYDGLFEYRQIKALKRKSRRFIPLIYFFNGFLYLIISLILYFVF